MFLHPTGVDITDLKQAEENYRKLAESLDAEVRLRTREVVQQSEQLRDLSSRLLQAQDEERRHIARELLHQPEHNQFHFSGKPLELWRNYLSGVRLQLDRSRS